jgi:hypothetical protein
MKRKTQDTKRVTPYGPASASSLQKLVSSPLSAARSVPDPYNLGDRRRVAAKPVKP